MPTPSSVGTTDFRIISVDEKASRGGIDGLTIVLKGKATGLAAAFASYAKGDVASGYPYMYLEDKSSIDRGPVAEITLNYIGALTRTVANNGRIDTSDSISRQSVSLNTTDDEDVSFSYMAQQTTTRWIYYGDTPPQSPRFRITVPSTISVAQLFGPNPPKYTGSLAGRKEVVGRLSQFDRAEIARGVYLVTESWDIQIEPVSTAE